MEHLGSTVADTVGESIEGSASRDLGAPLWIKVGERIYGWQLKFIAITHGYRKKYRNHDQRESCEITVPPFGELLEEELVNLRKLSREFERHHEDEDWLRGVPENRVEFEQLSEQSQAHLPASNSPYDPKVGVAVLQDLQENVIDSCSVQLQGLLTLSRCMGRQPISGATWTRWVLGTWRLSLGKGSTNFTTLPASCPTSTRTDATNPLVLLQRC